MIYKLLKKIVTEGNSLITKEGIEERVDFFLLYEKITLEQYQELKQLLEVI